MAQVKIFLGWPCAKRGASKGKAFSCMIHLTLYQPEIAGNVGTLLRLGACWQVPLHLVGPLSFVWSQKHLKRAAMDYLSHVDYTLYEAWEAYLSQAQPKRLVFLSPQATCEYTAFSFTPYDSLVVGSESKGFPKGFEQKNGQAIRIPMASHCRSLNMAVAAAIVLGEALRQTQLLPREPAEEEKFEG